MHINCKGKFYINDRVDDIFEIKPTKTLKDKFKNNTIILIIG